MSINDLLQLSIDKNASDLHLVAHYAPLIRVDGNLFPLDFPPLSGQVVLEMLNTLLTPQQQELFKQNHELDFGYTFGEGRFRVNAYFQRGDAAIAFRLIPLKIRSLEELNLPPIGHDLANLKQGLVLVTGPTGHGKSTTIASIINEINLNYGGHILTIEDPIEYIYPNGKALVSQRELEVDTYSWANALKAALREDPNVVLLGEMRDLETIAAALTIAETGHLVFATLHTNSAAQSVDRVVDVFPEHQQAQVRLQLSNVLEAIVSQRLLPAAGGGRVPAVEILLASPAVRSTIREGKTHMIDNIIQTSRDIGMQTLDQALSDLVVRGKMTYDVAVTYANNPSDFSRGAKKT